MYDQWLFDPVTFCGFEYLPCRRTAGHHSFSLESDPRARIFHAVPLQPLLLGGAFGAGSPLFRIRLLRLPLTAPGLNSLDNDLVDRLELAARQFLLHQLLGFGLQLNRHGCLDSMISRAALIS